MRIGFALPQFGGQAHTGNGVARFAREVEAAGAHSLWVNDRRLATVHPSVGYGGIATIPSEFDSILDPFALLALAAGVTDHVRLGTSALVAPLHPPDALARQLTTLDILSAGRLTAGFGIGWSPEEYEAAGMPFHDRDARLDETLDALEAIWTTGSTRYRGALLGVPEHQVWLKPVQTPRPPIHLEGFTPQCLTRVGRRGDGWLPALLVPGPPEQYQHLLRQREAVVRAAEAADRDPNAIETTVRIIATAGIPLQEITCAAHLLSDRTLFDTVLIDLLYLTDTADSALEAALHLLKLLT